LPSASARTIDLQDQQSSIGAQHNGKENEDQKKPQNLIYLRAANYDQVPAFHHHNQAGGKRKGQKNKKQCMLKVAIHSTEYLQDKVFRSINNNGQYFELHQKEY
jgi:hypothetical protein